MTTIRNINENYGDPVTFTAETLEQAQSEMAATLRAAFPDADDLPAADHLREGTDYEIVTA